MHQFHRFRCGPCFRRRNAFFTMRSTSSVHAPCSPRQGTPPRQRKRKRGGKKKGRRWLIRKRVALCTSKMRLWSGSGPIRSPIKRTASHKCSRRATSTPPSFPVVSRICHVYRLRAMYSAQFHRDTVRRTGEPSARPPSQNRKGDTSEVRKLFNPYPTATPVETITPISCRRKPFDRVKRRGAI